MSNLQYLYRAMTARMSVQKKTKIRAWLEFLLPIGERRYYSQFGEDAFLQSYFVRKSWKRDPRKSWTMFRSQPLQPGFYVDIGAYAPKQYSNTYWFYRRGWRGINIDATPGSIYAFNLARRHDVNLQIAVSSQESELLFYCWGMPSVLNTLSAEKIPSITDIVGHDPVEVRVKAMRLEHILDQHLPRNQTISFLSVDVEGHDLEVLQSNDWQKYRPELVVAEQYVDGIQEIMGSDIAKYMCQIKYSIYSWIKPSVIYRDSRLPDL